MGEGRGYTRLPRYTFESDKLLERKPWHPWMFWQWLVYLAAWKPREVRVGNQTVSLERGQCFHGERWLGLKPGWSRHKVANELNYLVADGRIIIHRGHLGTLVTIVNYDRWQSGTSEQGPRFSLVNGDTTKNGAAFGATSGATANCTSRQHIAPVSEACGAAFGATDGALSGPRRGHPSKNPEKKEKKNNEQPPDDPETGSREPGHDAAAAVEDCEHKEQKMTPLPEVVTEDMDVVRAAAQCVLAFQRTLPKTAKGSVAPPSPANFERVKAAIRAEGGCWLCVLEGIVAITAHAVVKNVDIGNIAYPLQVWESRASRRDADRAMAEAGNEPVDPRVSVVVAGLTGRMSMAGVGQQPRTVEPEVRKESPEDKARRVAWQEQRQRELDEEGRLDRMPPKGES